MVLRSKHFRISREFSTVGRARAMPCSGQESIMASSRLRVMTNWSSSVKRSNTQPTRSIALPIRMSPYSSTPCPGQWTPSTLECRHLAANMQKKLLRRKIMINSSLRSAVSSVQPISTKITTQCKLLNRKSRRSFKNLDQHSMWTTTISINRKLHTQPRRAEWKRSWMWTSQMRRRFGRLRGLSWWTNLGTRISGLI